MTYDRNNVFFKILKGEIPCKKVYENEFALAFHDINPQAPLHVLVIPKGEYKDHKDFSSKASNEEIAGFERAIAETAEIIGAVEGGYRLLSNCGINAGQEVPHYHVHIFGGCALGPMIVKK